MYMPYSLRILCLTNLFCWMSLVCYSLYFTDFVGEAVFGGDPSAAPGSEKRRLYDQGVQFGCWGMYYNGSKSLAMIFNFFSIHAQISQKGLFNLSPTYIVDVYFYFLMR